MSRLSILSLLFSFLIVSCASEKSPQEVFEHPTRNQKKIYLLVEKQTIIFFKYEYTEFCQ